MAYTRAVRSVGLADGLVVKKREEAMIAPMVLARVMR